MIKRNFTSLAQNFLLFSEKKKNAFARLELFFNSRREGIPAATAETLTVVPAGVAKSQATFQFEDSPPPHLRQWTQSPRCSPMSLFRLSALAPIEHLWVKETEEAGCSEKKKNKNKEEEATIGC